MDVKRMVSPILYRHMLLFELVIVFVPIVFWVPIGSMEWYADEVDVSPMALFNALNRIGKTPFSSYVFQDLCGHPIWFGAVFMVFGFRFVSRH